LIEPDVSNCLDLIRLHLRSIRRLLMDRLDQLMTLYDRREISRRDLLGALAVLGIGGTAGAQTAPAAREGVVQAKTINHVSLGVADVARSTEFYDRLLNLPVIDHAENGFCEYRLGNGFFGLYGGPGMKQGLDHVAIGVERYDVKTTTEALKRAFPKAKVDSGGDQVYITDPDGARIQFCAVDYKR
jgi:catechol 2,3-dioxygenase-like lactoylglutathione lyase family enzyme